MTGICIIAVAIIVSMSGHNKFKIAWEGIIVLNHLSDNALFTWSTSHGVSQKTDAFRIQIFGQISWVELNALDCISFIISRTIRRHFNSQREQDLTLNWLIIYFRQLLSNYRHTFFQLNLHLDKIFGHFHYESC